MKIRNNIYPLYRMEPGDRFYFVGDRKKTVFRLDDEKPFENIIQRGFRKRYANCIPADIVSNVKAYSERHLQERQVIFLRNINTHFNQKV